MLTETQKELREKYNWLIEQYNIGNIDFNDWENEFLDDKGNMANNLFAENGFLTEKQIDKLEEIYEKYNGQ